MLAKKLRVPAEDIEDGEYMLRPLNGPVLRGWKLKLFIRMVAEGPLHGLATGRFLRKMGFPQVRVAIFAVRTALGSEWQLQLQKN